MVPTPAFLSQGLQCSAVPPHAHHNNPSSMHVQRLRCGYVQGLPLRCRVPALHGQGGQSLMPTSINSSLYTPPKAHSAVQSSAVPSPAHHHNPSSMHVHSSRCGYVQGLPLSCRVPALHGQGGQPLHYEICQSCKSTSKACFKVLQNLMVAWCPIPAWAP